MCSKKISGGGGGVHLKVGMDLYIEDILNNEDTKQLSDRILVILHRSYRLFQKRIASKKYSPFYNNILEPHNFISRLVIEMVIADAHKLPENERLEELKKHTNPSRKVIEDNILAVFTNMFALSRYSNLNATTEEGSRFITPLVIIRGPPYVCNPKKGRAPILFKIKQRQFGGVGSRKNNMSVKYTEDNKWKMLRNFFDMCIVASNLYSSTYYFEKSFKKDNYDRVDHVFSIRL